LLAKLLVQRINIWDKWKRVELSIDTVLVLGKVQRMGEYGRIEKKKSKQIKLKHF